MNYILSCWLGMEASICKMINSCNSHHISSYHTSLDHLVPVWFQLRHPHFAFSVFFFFFFSCTWTVKSHDFTVYETKKILFMHYLYTVHRSHNTIYIFKNYFATIFSVFNFSNNKFNPNRPLTSILMQHMVLLQSIALLTRCSVGNDSWKWCACLCAYLPE